MKCAALLLSLLPASAHAAGGGVVGENLVWLALILMSARLFAPLAQKLGFPAVLGELLLGVLDDALFSVIVIMVILTTLPPPPVLTALLRRQRS